MQQHRTTMRTEDNDRSTEKIARMFKVFRHLEEPSGSSVPPRFPLGQKANLNPAEFHLSFGICLGIAPALCRCIPQQAAIFGRSKSDKEDELGRKHTA